MARSPERSVPARRKKAAPRERLYGGRSTEERRRDRRERLLQAGLSLFGGAGYGATTIPNLCTEAGIIPRYFYESFETREALLTEVFSRIVRLAVTAVKDALRDAPDDPLTRIRVALSAFLHVYLDDPRRARIVCVEVGGVSPALEKLRWQEMRRFAEVIQKDSERLAERGLLPRRDYRMGSMALAGATNQLIIDWLGARERPPVSVLEHEITLLFAAIFAGLGAAVATLGEPPGGRGNGLRGAAR